MPGPHSTVIPDTTLVTIPAAAGLDADSALPWLIDIDVFEQAIANVNWDTVVLDIANYLLGADKRCTNAQNNSISFDVVLARGTWTVELLHAKSNSHGIHSVQFDSVEKGTIDAYDVAGFSGNNLSSVSGIAVASTGKVRLSLVMATKNASSSGYFGLIQHIQLRRTA